MASGIDHVLLTRFNLPSEGVEGIIRTKEGWLERRITLFERYCLPSVRAQTCKKFNWIIYFDQASPDWLRCRIEQHVPVGAYVPIFRPSVNRSELIEDITRVTGRNGSYLMTTNLDNDDGLAVNFIERLQRVEPRSGRIAIYLARGLIRNRSRLYMRMDKHNAFCSVLDDWASASTCWSDWHNLLWKSMQVLDLYDEPGWLQVVHDTNVSNRVRGRLVPPGQYYALFPGLLDDVRAPKFIDVISDLAFAQPKRFVRESVRAMAKGAVMRATGKEGLDRLKVLLASTRGR